MKKTIKKLALILLTAALMLTVTGCGANDYQTAAVSYTHLTLPTIYSV